MSLRPDDRSSRTRDRSSTRDRDRSRSNVRRESPPSTVGYGDRTPGSFGDPSYEVRAPEGASRTSSYTEYYSSKTTGGAPYPPEDRYDPRYEQPQYREPDRYERREEFDRSRDDRDRGRDDRHDRHRNDDDDELAYGSSRHPSRQYSESIIKSKSEPDDKHRYSLGRTESQTYKTTTFAPEGARYAPPPSSYSSKYDDDRSDHRRQSSVTFERDTRVVETRPEPHRQGSSYERDTRVIETRPEPYRQGSSIERDTRIIETRPEHHRQSSKTYERDTRVIETRPEPHRQSSSTYERDTRIVEVTPGGRDRQGSDLSRVTRTSSNSLVPAGLSAGMHRLSVSGNRPDVHALGGAGGLPPPSPLLEAYHGTYQSISPMPTAMRMADDDLDDLPSLDYSKHSKVTIKEKKHVKLYDPEQDARTLAKALSSSSPNADVICDILPPLSDDQIWELRKEYKKQVKISGKGINLSKHLKMKLSGNFGKVVYVTALGRWESEGYWANFFYQSHGSRRELLIESLMGRTNADIRSIKDEFKDKRYNDDLVRCMEKELKMDKFRSAILMALEGRRQEEQDVYPQEYRDRDVDVLHRAIRGSGSESAMLEVVVRRSDAHLRDLLRQYEKMYGENFARVALKKSNNLVGEVIAHILNGVINKPARDALLLKHAIKDIAAHNKDDELRYELLISRLVRLHWDRLHMMRVKKEYKEKYGKYLEDDLEHSTKGDFKEFVIALCEVQGPR
ncbi:hypothetical protein AMS68_003899 [Peltaster fructicola]|uniref:Annexin n=1 Tax=Peltaster fructicola TaxID=286661 RepID=A0A6H0XUF2_9PEZI|nr:hypothetical protein AMS68_003899 [Peltaster fructicola]